MRTPAGRLVSGARPRRSRVIRGIVVVASAVVLGTSLTLSGPSPAGAQEICLDGTIVVVCPPTTAPPTEPATTTTARPTTTTQPPVTTTEAPPTTAAPTTAQPIATVPRTSTTARSTTAPPPTTTTPPPPATVAAETTAVATDPAPSTTVGPTAVTTTTTTAPPAPTTSPPGDESGPSAQDPTPASQGSVLPIGFSEDAAPPGGPGDGGLPMLALVVGGLAALVLVGGLGWRHIHGLEID